MTLRWSVLRGNLDPTAGHEQVGVRPLLVVSNEVFNRRSGLVTVLPLTTARRPPHPWEIVIRADSCGLPADSLALAHQIRTITSNRLLQPAYGRIVDPMLRRAIAEKVLRHLALHDLDRLALEP